MSSKRVRKESDLSAEELKSRGNKSFVDKKYDESVKWFTKAITKEPNNHIYYSNRSASHSAIALDSKQVPVIKKHAKLAILDAKKCVGIDKKFAKGHVRHAVALGLTRNFEAAVRVLKKALEVLPEDDFLKKNLKNFQEKMRKQDEEESLFKRKKPSGFKLREDDSELDKARKEELKALRERFLEDSKEEQKSERQRLLNDEGLVLPKYNIMGDPKMSGFQPFGDEFAIKHKRRKRKRKRINARD
ncbi:hypothetical protein AAMO2058_000614800 [Amorphochlora amoebiformis]